MVPCIIVQTFNHRNRGGGGGGGGRGADKLHCSVGVGGIFSTQFSLYAGVLLPIQSWLYIVQCMHSFTPPWTKQKYKRNTLPYKIASKAFPHPWNTLHAVEGMEMGRISTLAALFIIGIIFETTSGNQNILFIHYNIPCM